MGDDRGDQFAGERAGRGIALRVGEVTLQDGLRRALAEVRLEDRGEGESSAGPPSPLAVSLRHRRR